ncbi:MAG: xylulokinase [Myxococcota bacterium]
MELGIDLGTSGVKLVLIDDAQQVIAQESEPLEVQRPRPLWSEQDPEAWWRASCAALERLRSRCARELSAVRAIGLSGQMHGATLLDRADRVLRPAILWNDGRSEAQCAGLERCEPRARELTGNPLLAGFTAPKLLWVAEHEPEIFSQIATVLLPKDYLRLRLSGDRATDLSDASGTLWLDVGRRRWSPEMIAATGLEERQLPRLYEGSSATGRVRGEIARAWGLSSGVVIAAGAGDQAAGAVGAGVIDPGLAFLSLGTSGVCFVAGDRFAPRPERGVHAFCHGLPERWHQMSVILSAASCLAWVARLTGAPDEARLISQIETECRRPADAIFLPYLSGERTPHADPKARGVFFGLHHETTPAELGRAVLEGVAFALVDALAALLAAGAEIDRLIVIGGGARSRFWGTILASALQRPLDYVAGGEIGPAFGAARLARLAASGESPAEVCTLPPTAHIVEPEPELARFYRERIEEFRALYQALRERFALHREQGTSTTGGSR